MGSTTCIPSRMCREYVNPDFIKCTSGNINCFCLTETIQPCISSCPWLLVARCCSYNDGRRYISCTKGADIAYDPDVVLPIDEGMTCSDIASPKEGVTSHFTNYTPEADMIKESSPKASPAVGKFRSVTIVSILIVRYSSYCSILCHTINKR